STSKKPSYTKSVSWQHHLLLLFVTIKKRSFETITDINCFTCYAWNF
ncbi:hypothetical protein PPECC9_44650, partial [Escherichia coli PCN009]